MCDCRVTSVRENQGESGNFKVPFSNQRKSGKIDLFGKIREKSGNFIFNQGKKSGNFVIEFISYFYDFPKKITRAFGVRILTEFL